MFPTLRSSQVCIFRGTEKWHDGDIMLIRVDDKEMVKRLFLHNNAIHARGDSQHSSNYIISQSNIIAKLILPKFN